MARFCPIDRDSTDLFRSSVQDWLLETHLAGYIANVVESLDLSAIERAYAWRASDAYPGRSHKPADLRLRHRRLCRPPHRASHPDPVEGGLYDSVAFLRYFACNRHPDLVNLATFRGRFGDAFQGLLVQRMQIAQADRLSTFGTGVSMAPRATPTPATAAPGRMRTPARSTRR